MTTEWMKVQRMAAVLLLAFTLPPTLRATTIERIAPRIESVTFQAKERSQELRYTVVLPERPETDGDRSVLYLLHGRGRDDRTLIRNKGTRTILLRAGYTIVMPRGGNAWWINSPVDSDARGRDLLQAVMDHAEDRYGIGGISQRRAISGWSMGGYGAVRYAVDHPERLSLVAPIIGLLDYPRTGLPENRSYPVREGTFGRDPDFWRRLNPISDAERLRGLHILLVTADAAFDRTMNQNFHRRLERLEIDHDWRLLEGSHSMDVVAEALPRVLRRGAEVFAAVGSERAPKALSYSIERSTARSGFNGDRFWGHARAGAIPPGTPGNRNKVRWVILTTQQINRQGSDIFHGLHMLQSDDLGQSWTDPTPIDVFKRQEKKDTVLVVSDFTPDWHAATGKLLGTGHTVWYKDGAVMRPRPRSTAYSVYDLERKRWNEWRRLQLPDAPRFANAGAGSTQRFDLENGDILLPFYFKEPGDRRYASTVSRCRFDGETLHYAEHGSELTVTSGRGLYEPSLTRFRDRFYLTLRNDSHGYVAVSNDGLTFSDPVRWRFDDRADLGNYNTQQHWVAHSEGLFLVYTRRGTDNDHVFRHRAPLFIARVDPQTLRVIRESEQILVPEKGARLGNFGVVEVSPTQTWVTAAEWMQPAGVERHGSNNRIWIAKIKWNQPNKNQ